MDHVNVNLRLSNQVSCYFVINKGNICKITIWVFPDGPLGLQPFMHLG